MGREVPDQERVEFGLFPEGGEPLKESGLTGDLKATLKSVGERFERGEIAGWRPECHQQHWSVGLQRNQDKCCWEAEPGLGFWAGPRAGAGWGAAPHCRLPSPVCIWEAGRCFHEEALSLLALNLNLMLSVWFPIWAGGQQSAWGAHPHECRRYS